MRGILGMKVNTGKMGKHKDLSDFDKGRIVMARRLGQSIFKTAALVGFLVCSAQYLSKVVQGRKSSEPATGSWPRLIDARGEWKLLCMGLSSCRPVRVTILTPGQKCLQWVCKHQTRTTEQWKKVAWSDESRFRLSHHVDGRVHVCHLLGEHMHYGCTMGALWEGGKPADAVWCFGKCSAGKPWVLPFIKMLLWHLPPT